MVSVWKVNHQILLNGLCALSCGLGAPEKKKKNESQMTLPLKWQNSPLLGSPDYISHEHCRDATWWRISRPLAACRQCNQPVRETMETENTKKKKNEWMEQKEREGRELAKVN